MVFFSYSLVGQNQAIETGVFLGGSTYRGDVVKPDFFTLKDTRIAYGVFARYGFNEKWKMKASMIMTKLAAEDQNYDTDWRDERSFQFSTFLAELALTGEWHPLGTFHFNELSKKSWSPYLFAGVGFALFNPKPDFEENKIDQLNDRIAMDETNGFNKALITTPFGAGIRFQINNSWSVSVEGGARPAFTDYLDGISQSGQAQNDDWYGFGGILIGYNWGHR